MGKAEERCRLDCAIICEENLIWFEGMPVVIGDESMAAGKAISNFAYALPSPQSGLALETLKKEGIR